MQPIMRGVKIIEELTSGKGREESHMAIEENLLVRDQLLDRRRRRDAGAEEAENEIGAHGKGVRKCR